MLYPSGVWPGGPSLARHGAGTHRFVRQVLNLNAFALNFNGNYQGPFSAPASSHMSFPDIRHFNGTNPAHPPSEPKKNFVPILLCCHVLVACSWGSCSTPPPPRSSSRPWQVVQGALASIAPPTTFALTTAHHGLVPPTTCSGATLGGLGTLGSACS